MKVLLCGKCGNFEGSPKVEKKKKRDYSDGGSYGFHETADECTEYRTVWLDWWKITCFFFLVYAGIIVSILLSFSVSEVTVSLAASRKQKK